MARHSHHYSVTIEWTGNLGSGTLSYASYSRDHRILAAGGAPIAGSSDPAFRGDPARWNPEQMLVASLSACHQLWYLHLCAEAGIVVTAYSDAAEGTLDLSSDGGGQFGSVTLHPRATIAAGGDPALALALHRAAAEKCFIARSMAFPVLHDPAVQIA